MKKFTLLGLAALLFLTACAWGGGEPRALKTTEATPSALISDYLSEGKMVIFQPYEEMSDGTWRSGGHSYQYRLEITGRLHNASRDTTYLILSNLETLTFEQAWKASGLSSNTADYFPVEDAVFVGTA